LLLELQTGYVYGPVRSRRLGSSLGVNVLPPGLKVCSFNCAYCQYGWTAPEVLASPEAADFPDPAAILLDVAKALIALPEAPACVTFSGHGEATLHPGFDELVDGVTHLRNRFARGTRTAILSNSSTVHDPAVRAALARLDLRIMKLDAGSQPGLAAFNQPSPGVRLEAIVDGLGRLGGVTLQSLFAAGPAGNLDPREVDRYLEAVVAVAPESVQLYTLDRDVPASGLQAAPDETLEGIRSALQSRGVAATVFPARRR
jgi:wyosine [tRNA(Phe)-imidazoG37] synthetase (radical SAM superfamily)